MSDVKSLVKSKAVEFDNDHEDLIVVFLASKADKQQIQKKKDKNNIPLDTAKQAKLLDEIFDYIHVPQYKRLLSLV